LANKLGFIGEKLVGKLVRKDDTFFEKKVSKKAFLGSFALIPILFNKKRIVLYSQQTALAKLRAN
jgi:hypothetical protein